MPKTNQLKVWGTNRCYESEQAAQTVEAGGTYNYHCDLKR
jgi:plastocyanin